MLAATHLRTMAYFTQLAQAASCVNLNVVCHFVGQLKARDTSYFDSKIMQDEVTKHTKKIYNSMKNTEHTFGEKVKEVIIEIFIIVFAVTLSIWLHSWSEHRHQQDEVKSFLINLKKDLAKDIERFNSDKEGYLSVTKRYEFITNVTPSQTDSLKKNKIAFNIPFFTAGIKTNDGNYEGFKSSGKIGNIENGELKQLIVEYYQQSIPNVNEADKIYLDFMLKIIEFNIENAGQENKLSPTNPQLKERLKYAILLGKSNVGHYDEDCIKKAKEIIKDINTELQK